MLSKLLYKLKKTIEYVKPLDTAPLFFGREARLVYINGTGALSSTFYKLPDSGPLETYMRQIAFNGIPLANINSSGCPTCESLIAAGCGIEKTDSAEFRAVSEAFNEDYTDLDTAIDRILPLLSLLQSGLYVLADTSCYPTDGNGNFFWDVPDGFTSSPATAAAWLNDEDYECEYVNGFPAYLYPTQSTDCYNEVRVRHYIDRFQTTDMRPRGIAYHCGEFLSFLLDGHHKACAAAAIGESLPCLVIIPLDYCSYTVVDKKTVPFKLVFGPYALDISEVPKKYISHYRKNEASQSITTRPAEEFSGTLTRRSWEKHFLDSALVYPKVHDLAIMSLTGVSDVSDEVIEGCLLTLSEDNRKKLRSILRLLDMKNDSRLKRTALACAKQIDSYALKLEAFRLLAKMKSDDDVTDFFINWIVYDTDPHSLLARIANSYLDSLSDPVPDSRE